MGCPGNCGKRPRYAGFCFQTGPEKNRPPLMPADVSAIFSAAHLSIRISSTPPHDCKAIINRRCGESALPTMVLALCCTFLSLCRCLREFTRQSESNLDSSVFRKDDVFATRQKVAIYRKSSSVKAEHRRE